VANIRSSLLIVFSQNYINIGLQLAASIVVARVLSPGEIGVFSVAMVIVAIGNSLRDFGCGDYVVQVREFDETRQRAVSAMTFMMAWGLAALIYAGSGWVAEFYREPGVGRVLDLLTVNFLLLPFGMLVMANLRREMEFRVLAVIRVVSTLIQVGVTIGLALNGHSYMSMAWGAILSSVFNIAVAQYLRPKDLPILPGLKGLKEVFTFGVYHSTSTIMGDLSKGAPDLVLGRVLGMAAVAYFGRALGLLDMFNRLVMEAVNFVALPHLSNLNREGKSLSDSYLASLPYLTGLAWPFFAFLGIMALPIIRVLYGDQWDASVPLLRYLSVGEILLAPFLMLTAVMVSAGRIAADTKRNVVVISLRVLALFLLASNGLEILAIGFVLASLLGALYSLRLARDILGFSYRAFFTSMLGSFWLTLAASAGPLIVAISMEKDGGMVLPLLLSSGLALAGWLAAVYLLRHPMRVEIGQGIRLLKTRLTAGS